MISQLRLVGISCVFALSSCTISSGLSNVVSNRPYELGSKPLRAEATAFAQAGTTTLYLRLNRDQLLYTRDTPNSPFTSEFSVSIDTLNFNSSDTLEIDSPQWIDLELNFNSSNTKRLLNIELTDLNRNISERLYVEPNNYLVWDIENDKSIDPSNAEIGSTLMIHSPGVEAWEVYLAHPPTSLPAPPFTGSRNPLDTVVARPFSISDGSWVVREGCQFFYNNKTERSFIINGRRAYFPKSINVEDLLECTRYIATRDEYSQMLKSEHPKLALDEFWLECGGSRDKARKLIEIYYDRVEEANTFFSGMQEGWRTDRGMIHIVMGVPDKVRRDKWNEVWLYGDEDNPNSVVFVFNQREHRLDDNIYVLDRSAIYRNTWDRVVTSWRNGRVQGD
ncbi:MAG: hypothetical protein CL847_07525 [Crocinitomicaceae bacterium]|nr:hypothetical protein [Crocinitomicaceae bacterium]